MLESILVGVLLFLSPSGAYLKCDSSHIVYTGDASTWNYSVNSCQNAIPDSDSDVDVRIMTTEAGEGIVDIPGVGTLIAHPTDPAQRAALRGASMLEQSRWHVRVRNHVFGVKIELTR